jgi:hypothetical protein
VISPATTDAWVITRGQVTIEQRDLADALLRLIGACQRTEFQESARQALTQKRRRR